MRDISSHILDIAQNSIVAGATLVELTVDIDTAKNLLKVVVGDNGCGMSEDLVKRVIDPFVTSRKTRKVGLGIPLLKEGAERAMGTFDLKSKEGVGTQVTATYALDCIDRPPVGELAETIHSLIQMNPNIDFDFKCAYDGKTAGMDTRELRKVLGEEVPLDNIDVSLFILDNLTESLKELFGGKEI